MRWSQYFENYIHVCFYLATELYYIFKKLIFIPLIGQSYEIKLRKIPASSSNGSTVLKVIDLHSFISLSTQKRGGFTLKWNGHE